MTCREMAFFPANFLLQTGRGVVDDDGGDHQQPFMSINQILQPSCTPHLDFNGIMGRRRREKRDEEEERGEDEEEEETLGEEIGMIMEMRKRGGERGEEWKKKEKKKRLNMEQVKTLERNFEEGNKKLEPERKMKLARALGLEPRQIAIWFQNRRARWKTKQLERDFLLLKQQFDSIKADNHALLSHNHSLLSKIMELRSNNNKELLPKESINLNKDIDGCCSHSHSHSHSRRSTESNSDLVRLDVISRSATPPIDDGPLPPSSHPHSAAFRTISGVTVPQLFQQSSKTDDGLHHQTLNNINNIKEDVGLCSMFCASIDVDHSGLWPWLDHQHLN